MFVSVVIPTKDRPVPLVDAVRSVFAGSYQHFELFVADGFGTTFAVPFSNAEVEN